MKPKHRHELKTNELAEWIANLPQWAQKNARMIIYISIVAVCIVGAYFYHSYRATASIKNQLALTDLITRLSQSKIQILGAQAQGIDYSFILLQPAEDLEIFAENTKDNQMAALALIKRADALRTELHYRLGAASQQELATQLNKAKASYTEALSRLTGPGERGTINPSLTAAAKFGLGLCEEELDNFENARQIYRDITENAYLEGTVAADQAKNRLNTMADYQRKIVFRQLPKPAPTKPIQPPTELQPGTEPAPDINIGTEMPQLDLQLLDTNIESDIPSSIFENELYSPNSANEVGTKSSPTSK